MTSQAVEMCNLQITNYLAMSSLIDKCQALRASMWLVVKVYSADPLTPQADYKAQVSHRISQLSP